MGSTGTLMLWLALENPPGWLDCDGKVYHKEVSPELHAMLRSIPSAHSTRIPPEFFRVPDATPLLPPGTIVKLIIKS